MANPVDPGYTSAAAITPSDVTVVNFRAFYVGVSGNVTIDPLNGLSNTTLTLVQGRIYPIAITRVYATGTTATNLIGLN
jgi:hypothetical protein